MLSLRSFHIFFVVIAMLAADLFGIWSVWDYASQGHLPNLILGVVSLFGGLGLLAYGIWFIHQLDRANVH